MWQRFILKNKNFKFTSSNSHNSFISISKKNICILKALKHLLQIYHHVLRHLLFYISLWKSDSLRLTPPVAWIDKYIQEYISELKTQRSGLQAGTTSHQGGKTWLLTWSIHQQSLLFIINYSSLGFTDLGQFNSRCCANAAKFISVSELILIPM